VLSCPAQASIDLDYVDFLRNPKNVQSNPELRGYFLGIAAAIRMDYVCSEADRAILIDIDKIADELVGYASTIKGKMAIEGVLGLGGNIYRSQSGSVLMAIFTESFRCVRHDKPKTQIYP
jgi:hypothetical protein